MCFQINEFVSLVSQCAKSPVHKTRELAARALVPLLTNSTVYNIVKRLFLVLCTAQDTRISTNLTHGYLLQVSNLVVKIIINIIMIKILKYFKLKTILKCIYD